MSLAVLANHMASKGRNGDSMLVHMTPEEVHGLQALALAHGGSLTINPETGLVEASWLKKLLPAIAGMALNFIAPGIGSAIGSMLPSALGLSAATAGAIGTGIAVGGVTGLATGSLKQGIMAGLGAYGGASLAGGLSAAGAAGAEQAALSGITPEQIAQYSELGIPQSTLIEDVTRNAGIDFAKKGAVDQFTGSIGALTEPAGRSAFMAGVGGPSGAMRAGFAAAGPALAEPPKTDMPSLNQYTGMVRPFTFDPYGQTYTPMEPYKAASGGIVALADGGLPDLSGLSAGQRKYAENLMGRQGQGTPQEIFDYVKGLSDYQSLASLASAQGKQGLMQPSGFDTMRALGTEYGVPEMSYGMGNVYNTQTGQTAQAPAPTGIATLATQPAVMSPEQFKQNIYQGGADDVLATQRGVEYARAAGLTPQETLDLWNKSLGTKFGMADYERVMKQFPEVTPLPRVEPEPAPAPATAPIVNTPTVGPVVPGTKGEDKTYGGDVVLDRVTPPTPGTPGKVTQENKTMQQVRDEYQKGGGSLGMPIIPFTPTPLTGGSKAAYDYLMGKGAYPTVPFTPTGEIMRPYAESVLGVPVDKTRSKMIFDPATRKYIPNPDYVAPKFPNVPGTGADGQPIIRDYAGNPYTGLAAAYFAANPDVKSAFEKQVDGMSADDYVRYHWNTFGKNEGRKGYVDTVTPAPVGEGSQEPNVDIVPFARGGLSAIAAAAAARGGNVEQFNLGGYSDGGRLLRGPGDGVSDSIPATIGNKQPARLADGEFVIPARIVSEIGNGSTEAGARKLYAMMDRVQRARAKTTGKGKVAKNTRAEKYLPA